MTPNNKLAIFNGPKKKKIKKYVSIGKEERKAALKVLKKGIVRLFRRKI